jgi:hypothetical protein
LGLLVTFASARGEDAAPEALNQCGDCHMVFPADMLPKRSWVAILGGLDNHFGENAGLPAKDRQTILDYLSAHSADAPTATPKERHYLGGLLDGVTPLRITQSPWWSQMHADYSFEATKHPGLKSPANCQACHANGFD